MIAEFECELTKLINRYSIENMVDMPDFLLARMLCAIIESIGHTVKATLDWHGCDSVCHPRHNAALAETLLKASKTLNPVVVETDLWPCNDCGKLMTKVEGGKVFALCEVCRDKRFPKQSSVAVKRDTPSDRTERQITIAHHEACTCGGAGPGEGCPACNMWHYLYTINAGADGKEKA